MNRSVKGADRRKLIPLSDCKSVAQASKLKDEEANFGRLCRLCFGSVGGWHHDLFPGLTLDIRAVKVKLLAGTGGAIKQKFRGAVISPVSLSFSSDRCARYTLEARK
jgi:hypothetical protein